MLNNREESGHMGQRAGEKGKEQRQSNPKRSGQLYSMQQEHSPPGKTEKKRHNRDIGKEIGSVLDSSGP